MRKQIVCFLVLVLVGCLTSAAFGEEYVDACKQPDWQSLDCKETTGCHNLSAYRYFTSIPSITLWRQTWFCKENMCQGAARIYRDIPGPCPPSQMASVHHDSTTQKHKIEVAGLLAPNCEGGPYLPAEFRRRANH